MKKKLWLVVASFVLLSVMAYAVVGWTFFWGKREPADAVQNSTVTKAFYTVDFVTHGTTTINSQAVPHGQKATKPVDPTFEGCIFMGWYLDANYSGEPFDFDKPITSDMTLYACWNAIIYTVTFDSCGGTAVAAIPVMEGKKITEPTTEWTGYEFRGWYTDEAYSTPFDFDQKITQNITLYAKWSIRFTLAHDGESYGVTEYDGTASAITIPAIYRGKPVTYIGKWVFENCQTLTSVVIEEGVLRLDRCVFYGCSNLMTIIIPVSVIEIDEDAFRNCPAEIIRK
ncbi:MAG: InlB B-repeat-containing protein [Clostridia bacterium]|nr:InlB B-repeat-containing protein [Clostridia bacterium]